MNKQELNNLLDSHAKWLRSEESGIRADLSGADLRGADLRGADLRGADLRGADLRGADLNCADLSYANLSGAYLSYAYLSYANLSYANLSGANLSDTDLRGAYLRGAKSVIQWQSPLGGKRICYSVKHANCVMHKLGCFWGTTEQAVEAIRGKYGSGSMYEKLLVLNAKALEGE